MDIRALLIAAIMDDGPILTARISQAGGQRAGRRTAGYRRPGHRRPYYDVVPYKVIVTRDGRLSNVSQGRARLSRRSHSLVNDDLWEYCRETGRIELDPIGELSDQDVWNLLCDYVNGLTRHDPQGKV